MMTCKWLRKAEEDLVVARDELGKIPWISAFHSQQGRCESPQGTNNSTW